MEYLNFLTIFVISLIFLIALTYCWIAIKNVQEAIIRIQEHIIEIKQHNLILENNQKIFAEFPILDMSTNTLIWIPFKEEDIIDQHLEAFKIQIKGKTHWVSKKEIIWYSESIFRKRKKYEQKIFNNEEVI